MSQVDCGKRFDKKSAGAGLGREKRRQADALQTLRVVEAGRRPAYTFVKMTIIVNVVDVLNVHCIPNKL
jgi:hypothetical protein